MSKTNDFLLLPDAALDVLTDRSLLAALRYAVGPPISEDDLKTIAQASFSSQRLHNDSDMVERVVDIIRSGLDTKRFHWLTETREPTDEERSAAVLASAALMAVQRVRTARAHAAKAEQEEAVSNRLRSEGLTEETARTVNTHDEAPARGAFCGESTLGNRKADLIIRLHDGRIMPVECKVSNSATNSVKRLNNDAAAKAVAWVRHFGEVTVPAAVLSGVYKTHNLEQAQESGLAIFWAHDLDPLVDFIASTR